MEPGDRNFYRPAILWGAATALVAFLGEYVANDGTLGRALLLAGVAALLVGLFFARLLSMKEGRQRRPRYYEGATSSGVRNRRRSNSSKCVPRVGWSALVARSHTS